jgi:hypothetical protein
VAGRRFRFTKKIRKRALSAMGHFAEKTAVESTIKQRGTRRIEQIS